MVNETMTNKLKRLRVFSTSWHSTGLQTVLTARYGLDDHVSIQRILSSKIVFILWEQHIFFSSECCLRSKADYDVFKIFREKQLERRWLCVCHWRFWGLETFEWMGAYCGINANAKNKRINAINVWRGLIAFSHEFIHEMMIK